MTAVSVLYDLAGLKHHRRGKQPGFDKQFAWDHSPPAPPLPADVVSGTTAKYRDAYRRITGEELPDL